jgi:hypothetical protein
MGALCGKRNTEVALKKGDCFSRAEANTSQLLRSQAYELTIIEGEATPPYCPRKSSPPSLDQSLPIKQVSQVDISTRKSLPLLKKTAPPRVQEVKLSSTTPSSLGIRTNTQLNYSALQLEDFAATDPYDRLHRSALGAWKPVGEVPEVRRQTLKLLGRKMKKTRRQRLREYTQQATQSSYTKPILPSIKALPQVLQVLPQVLPQDQSRDHVKAPVKMPRVANCMNRNALMFSINMKRSFSKQLIGLAMRN